MFVTYVVHCYHHRARRDRAGWIETTERTRMVLEWNDFEREIKKKQKNVYFRRLRFNAPKCVPSRARASSAHRRTIIIRRFTRCSDRDCDARGRQRADEWKICLFYYVSPSDSNGFFFFTIIIIIINENKTP
jgi:hypothetical protein